ncbi:MAG: DUF4348 domain-containing protein [Bacteroidaceae bacterium]|nr:DUF4348 domain-containing protein [Bacteroidaceae bacterium]
MKLFAATLLIIAMTVISLSGCRHTQTNKAEETDSIAVENVDSLMNEPEVLDSTPMSEVEKIMGEKPMPRAADELFDDFFFNFSNNRKVQKQRIVWPLKYMADGETEEIGESQWQMEKFCADDGFYVVLLDNEDQIALAKDTALNEVVVNHVDIPQNSLKSFTFNRIEGKWMMTEIEAEELSDSRNADFLQFYQKFATDTTFCYDSLEPVINFTGPDEQDENLTTTRVISCDEYADWAPELAADFFSISYGQRSSSSNNKVFIMRQPSSSQECRLYFHRKGSHWSLYRLVE